MAHQCYAERNENSANAHHISLHQAWPENGCLELLGLSMLASLSRSEQIAPRGQERVPCRNPEDMEYMHASVMTRALRGRM